MHRQENCKILFKCRLLSLQSKATREELQDEDPPEALED